MPRGLVTKMRWYRVAVQFDVFTLEEVKKAGDSLLRPTDGGMWLMPPATWKMIETNPDHPSI